MGVVGQFEQSQRNRFQSSQSEKQRKQLNAITELSDTRFVGGDNGSRGNVCRPLLAATKTLVKLSQQKDKQIGRKYAADESSTDGRTPGRTTQTHAQTHGRTDARTHGRTNARTNARTDARRFINIYNPSFFSENGRLLEGLAGAMLCGNLPLFSISSFETDSAGEETDN